MAKALAKRLAYCLLWIVTAALVAVCLAPYDGVSEAAPAARATDTRQPTATWAPTATPKPPRLPCQSSISIEARDGLVLRLKIWKKWMVDGAYGPAYLTRLPPEIPLGIIGYESRGWYLARGAAGETGLFQILPKSVYFGRPTRAWLEKPGNNIRYGLYLLERMAWYGYAYWTAQDPTYYRKMDAASELDWWYSDPGRAALAMYNCGPGAYMEGRCGQYGGDYYAEQVLSCWVPWVQREVLGIVYTDERRALWAFPSE